jgi:hypothetical protein
MEEVTGTVQHRLVFRIKREATEEYLTPLLKSVGNCVIGKIINNLKIRVPVLPSATVP